MSHKEAEPQNVMTPAQYTERYINNYELWMKEILGAEITSDQRKCDLSKHNFIVAKSGTTTGKTTRAATTALWFLTTRYESKVVCTAPTGHQLEDLLFAEMTSWIRKIKVPFIRDSIVAIKGKIYIKGYSDWYIVGRTIPKDAKDKLGDVLAGFHAPYLLFLIDEASGVPDPVFLGIEGSMIQKNVYCLMVGNPTRPNGYFYDAFNKNKAVWYQVTLSSINSPFAQREWIERMRTIHGEDSDFFKTKVLGEFPSGAGTNLFSLEMIQSANMRWNLMEPPDSGIVVAGLDPSAGQNDSSVLTIRRGGYIFKPYRIKHKNVQELSAKCAQLLRDHGAKEVFVEYNGCGCGAYDLLRVEKGFTTYKVVTNARAADPEAYKNLRAELYKQLSDAFPELAIPEEPRYFEELTLFNVIEEKEPLQVVDKVYIKNKLGYSPDYSDSLMLCTFRHFVVNRNHYTQIDVNAFLLMNNNLAVESTFEKI